MDAEMSAPLAPTKGCSTSTMTTRLFTGRSMPLMTTWMTASSATGSAPILPKKKGWEYDECESVDEEDYDLRSFSDDFMNRFPDFSKTNENISRTRRAILESPLFYVAVEDNEWSTAVELIQKDVNSDLDLNSQNALYRIYLDAMKKILLWLFPSIGIYTGPWTHGIITREEAGLC